MKKLFALFLGLVMALSFCVVAPTNAATSWNGWESVAELGFNQGSDTYSAHPIRHFTEFGDYLISAGGSTTSNATIYKSLNGTDWEAASPVGLGDNLGLITDMAVFKGGLFVSGAHSTKGGQIWRTYNAEINGWDEIMKDGFGEGTNLILVNLEEFNGYLYVQGILFGAAPLVDSVTYRSSDGVTWERIFGTGALGNELNSPISMVNFNGKLYQSFSLPIGGARIYTSENGTDWEWMFGRGIDETDNYSLYLYEYQGVLYAGAATLSEDDPIVYQTTDGQTWQRIPGPVGINDQTYLANPTYGYNGNLYVSMRSADHGGQTEIWRYRVDSGAWDQITEAGFGDFDNYTLMAETYFQGYLFASAFNTTDGSSIWRKAIEGESTQTVQTLPETGANL